MMTKLKMVLDLVYTDSKVFKQLIKLALNSWSDDELEYLAEFLAMYFSQPDQAFSEYLLISRLKDIFEVEAKIKEEAKELFLLNDSAFVMKLFYKIIETSECRNYARFVMKDIYDNTNLEFLESIAFRNKDVKFHLQKRSNLTKRDCTLSSNINDNLTAASNVDEVEE